MISLDEALAIHAELIEATGGSHGVRDRGGLEAAVARPFATFAGQDLYPDAASKAAALLESVVKNHPFVDGNKRWLHPRTIDASYLRPRPARDGQ